MHASSSPRERASFALLNRFLAFGGGIVLAALIGTAGVHAQSSGVMSPGSAAVTGFSGIPNPPSSVRIDPDGPSLRVVPLPSSPNGLVNVTKPFTVAAHDIGQVFGVALDDQAQPDIFAAATSAYGLAIYQPGQGRLQHGATGAQYTPGLFGPPGQGAGPGSIWRIDGVSGQVSLFANVTFNGIGNTPAALGGLAYDPRTQQLFVADRATGMIHRFGMDGSDRGVFDQGMDGRAAAHLPPVPFDPATLANIASPSFDAQNPKTWGFAPAPRRIFALTMRGSRLYYSVAEGPSVWSVGILPDGSFAHDAHYEVGVPALKPGVEISQIAFDSHPYLYVAERAPPTGAPDFHDVADGGQERVMRFPPKNYGDPAPGYWQPPGEQYAIGMLPQFQNADGGVDIRCGSQVWATGEQLLNPGNAADGSYPQIDGLQGTDRGLVEPANMPPQQSRYVNYYDGQAMPDSHGHMGGLAIWNMCSGGPTGYVPPPAPPPVQIGFGCPPGTLDIDGTCVVPPACPPGAEYRDGYCIFQGCPDGFIRLRGECVPPPIGCRYGEVYLGDRCIPIGCPPGLVRGDNGYCHCPDRYAFRDGRCGGCPDGRDARDGRCGGCTPEQMREGQCGGCTPEQMREGRCGGCTPEQMRAGQCGGCTPEQRREGQCGGCTPEQMREGQCGGCTPEQKREGKCGNCPPGEARNSDGVCVGSNNPPCPPATLAVNCTRPCPQGESRNADGVCERSSGCPRGETMRDGRCVSSNPCPRGEHLSGGRCVRTGNNSSVGVLQICTLAERDAGKCGHKSSGSSGKTGTCTREMYDEGRCGHKSSRGTGSQSTGSSSSTGTCTREMYDEGLCGHKSSSGTGTGSSSSKGGCTREMYDEGLCGHKSSSGNGSQSTGSSGSSGNCTREMYDQGLCGHKSSSGNGTGSQGYGGRYGNTSSYGTQSGGNGNYTRGRSSNGGQGTGRGESCPRGEYMRDGRCVPSR